MPRVGGIEGVGDFYGDVEEVFQIGIASPRRRLIYKL
jgi:hypothetical protein